MRRIVTLGLLVLWLPAGCSPVVRDKPVEIPGAVKQLVVEVDHGNLEIIATAEVTKVELVRMATKGAPAGQGSQYDVKDGVLTVHAQCGPAPKCKVNHRIRVPLDVTVKVDVKDGDVALVDITGDIEVSVGLGNVSGLRLSSAHTDVHVEGGNIDLIFAQPPQALQAQAAAGDVDLRVPEGDYKCELDKKAVPPFGVKCVNSATRTISAATAVGRVSLRATD